MRKIVIPDASVVAKWYLVEELREQALQLRNDYIDGKIAVVVPSILFFEVLNAVRFSRRDITEEQLVGIGRSLALYGFEVHDLRDEEYLVEVASISLGRELPVYDSSYVALAKVLGGVMYTADENLLERLDEEERAFCHHIREYRGSEVEP